MFTRMKSLACLAALAAITLAASGCAGSRSTSTAPPAKHAAPPDFAVTRVQAAWPMLGMFPRTPGGGTRRCSIPGPGISLRPIPAICRTTVSTGNLGPTVVTFTESWPGRLFRYAGSGLRRHHHSWRFDVQGARGRVILVKEFGDFPPQNAR